MKTYIIDIFWDDEACVWGAVCDDIPLALEHGSYDTLIERIQTVAQEMLELNHNTTTPVNLLVKSERLISNG